MGLMVPRSPVPDKAFWRREMAERLAAFGDERLREEGELRTRLDEELRQRRPEWVLATLPWRDEPDLTPVLAAALGRGVRIALARVADEGLVFHEVHGFEGPWDVHRWGLREPPVSLPRWPGGNALCLVPGVAFAPWSGRVARLGRGGGFYDRWLAENGVFSLGVGYSVQAVDRLPLEPHDRTLDGWLIPGKSTLI